MSETTRDAAAQYLAAGRGEIVAIPKNEKGPRDNGWPARTYGPGDIQPDGNLGHKHPSGGRVDVDLDTDEAIAAARLLLPRTLTHGRPSKPRSHWWYLSDGIKSRGFKDTDGTMLVEIRCTRGLQTMIPPSVHPSGERLAWDSDCQPFAIAADDLEAAVLGVATAALLSRHWPKGSRHEAARHAGGFLAARGIDPKVAGDIVAAAAEAAGDDEVKDRWRAASESAAKHAKGEHVTGGPSLAKELPDGDAVVKRLSEWFGAVAEGIDANEQDLSRATALAWGALAAKNEPPFVFRYGGVPSRLEQDDLGQFAFRPLTIDRMRHVMARVTPWFSKGKGGFAPAMPPLPVMRDMLAQADTPLPVVTRIVSAPTVAPDGSVQTATGYQAATRTYYPAPGLDVPPVPDAPTDADVAAAVGWIDEMLCDFPFVGDPERAHAIAALLLPFVRELIDGPTPLHLFEKPTPGTGATLLATALTWPALGRDAAALTEANDDDEWRKRLTSTLQSGPSVLLIDNARTLTSPHLAAAITGLTWADRRLGASENVELPVRCAWLATGNNPTLSGEISRRCIRIRLDARIDRPWLRGGFRHPDLRGWIAAHRRDLVWAALTIARAWVAAGRPAGTKGLGMFESWARTLGGMLRVAKIEGFMENAEEFYEASDEEGAAVRWFLAEWWATFQAQPVTTGKLSTIGLSPDSLLSIEGKSDRATRTQFGTFVRKLRDQVRTLDDGRTVQVIDGGAKVRGAATWRLVRVTKDREPSEPSEPCLPPSDSGDL